jgi:lipopolysaccharide export system ATP-binding protein
MTVEQLRDYVAGLVRSDASIALALLELLRNADEEGCVERTEWVTGVRTAHARLRGDRPIMGGGGARDDDSAAQLARYLRDHVIARLSPENLLRVEPELDGWQQVRIEPGLWQAITGQREALTEELEGLVRNLLKDGSAPGPDAPDSEADGGVAGSTLRSQGLVKIYRKRKVVNEVSVQVSQGEIVGLLGPNGAGKTTTFYMVVGLIRPDEGRVFLDDRELTDTPMYKRARIGVGYLAQEPSIFRKLTVEENILAILETMKLSRAERKRRLEGLLDELGLKPLRKAKAYSLSGGERRRLEITRALVSRPKFMLLDEPFAGVDPIAVHDIQQIVADLRHRGIGVIISDHNVEQTLEIVDRAYIMYDGRVRVSGTVAELVWNDDVAEIYFGPTLTERMRERYSKPELV